LNRFESLFGIVTVWFDFLYFTGVQWEASMSHMLAQGVAPRAYFETGPGKQLKAMLRKMDQDAFKACTVIDVM
jgi:hypothetical protein